MGEAAATPALLSEASLFPPLHSLRATAAGAVQGGPADTGEAGPHSEGLFSRRCLLSGLSLLSPRPGALPAPPEARVEVPVAWSPGAALAVYRYTCPFSANCAPALCSVAPTHMAISLLWGHKRGGLKHGRFLLLIFKDSFLSSQVFRRRGQEASSSPGLSAAVFPPGHSPGTPVYREKEDMYDEIMDLKKVECLPAPGGFHSERLPSHDGNGVCAGPGIERA